MKNEENYAVAVGMNLRISRKYAIETARFIKGKDLKKAVADLEKVIKKEKYVPFTRYLSNAGHRKGGTIGKFPVKAAHEIARVLKSAEQNANYKGLGKDLYVKEIIVNTGRSYRTPKRFIGRIPKRTHIKIKVCERE